MDVQAYRVAVRLALDDQLTRQIMQVARDAYNVSSSNTSQFTYKPQGIQISGNSVSAASAGSGAITFHFLAIGY